MDKSKRVDGQLTEELIKRVLLKGFGMDMSLMFGL